MKMLSRIVLVLALTGLLAPLYAKGVEGESKKGPDRLAKTATNDLTDFISINNVFMYISNNGNTAYNPVASGNGFIFPKGSGKSVIFEDGFIWGGTVGGELRVGGSTYRQGLQAGPIRADGSAAPPEDPRYRIYKIRNVGNNTEKLATLTAEEQTRLEKDFMEWPVVDGAIFIDSNNNGIYDPNFTEWVKDSTKSDKPWFIGDEVLWFVMNDLDPARTSNLYGTAPVGLEVQTMVWAYEQTGPLGNMVFTKYTFTNRGTDDLENTFVAKWSDPDLGDANDDLVGVDTTLSLGYVYNGVAKDGVYGIPPAAGYDFFQGPIVPGDPNDEAIFNFKKIKGFKNLGVGSFAFYINGDAVYRDPDLGTPTGGQQMYAYLNGLLWNNNPYVDPTTGLTTKFCLAGDPIAKTGWLDGNVHSPQDRRFLMTAGPFTLKKNDIQEVVVSSMVALGSDRLSSVQVLKYYDRFAQRAFDNNFDLPKAPPQPTVTATSRPNEIVLSWGEPNSVASTEGHNDRGYAFQGYNVYQFPNASSTLAEGKRLATFDLVDNVATIFDEVIDNKSGAVVVLPVQFGTDSGIDRLIAITRDAMTDRPLVNNQPYYFGVTAYAFNTDPESTPRQLESSPKIITVRPQTSNPGYRSAMKADEMIPVNHTAGLATGSVLVKVIDPTKITGDSYEVSFTAVGTETIDYEGTEMDFPVVAWNLKDMNTGKTLIDKSAGYGGLDADYYIIDGFQIGLSGAGVYPYGAEVLSAEWSGGPDPYIYNTPWEAGYLFFGSSIAGYDVKRIVQIRFDHARPSKAYVYLRGGTPNYSCQGYFDSPLSVWDITEQPERQLQWAIVEQNGGATQNNKWGPVGVLDREYFFILNDTYDENPNPTYTNFKINADAGSMPILYAGWAYQDGGTNPEPWQDGDMLTITPNVPFDAADKFTFTTEAAKSTFTTDNAKKDVEAINVFPNPYYGANAQELNKYQRFVTFNHLPTRAIFRIYTISGTLVRSFEKNDGSQIVNWDLLNDAGLPVGSGMYVVHIDMPDLGVEKILKLGLVMEAQFLDRI